MRYRFGPFALDADRFSLARAGDRVEIEPKVLDLLLLLLRNRSRVVAKDVATSHLWPDSVVGPEALRRLVKEARRALGDDGRKQEFITTVRRRGLRFVAPVEVDREGAADVYVGREQLLRRIDDCLGDVLAGESRTLLLRGDAGIGKTRSAQEIAERARLQGFEVACAWATDEDGSGPFWLWAQVLRELCDGRDDATLRKHLAGAGPQLAEIWPSLRERLPNLARLPVLEAGPARIRLFDGFCSLLSHAAADRPIVLILDDLHAADSHSLDLLRFLSETATSAALCVVATYRSEEMQRDSHRMEIMDALAGGAAVQSVDLEPFGPDEVMRFVENHTGRAPPEDIVSRLLRATAGNLLLLTETMRDIDVEGTGGWLWADALPVDFDGVIGRHLARLSLPTRAILRVASVLGREFADDALERLHGSSRAVEVALAEARSVQVLSPSQLRAGAHRFAHALIRDALYAELGESERLELHARVGASLEAAPDRAAKADSLAHHFFTAFAVGESDKAAEYSELAGDQAMRVCASTLAVGHYRNALDMAQSVGDDDSRRICRLLLKLGDAQRGSIDEGGARATYREAADLALESGLVQVFSKAALGFAGLFLNMRRPDEETVTLIEKAIALLGDDELALKAELLTRLATEFCLHPDSEFVIALRQRAFDAVLASPAPDALLHLSTYAYTGILETLVPASERAELIERSLAQGEESGSHRMRVAAQLRLATEYLARGDLTRHDEIVSAAHGDAVRSGDPYEKLLTLYHRQFRAFIDGRFDDAERLCNEAVVYGQSRVDVAAARQVFVLQLGMLRAEQGRLHELTSTIDLTAERTADRAHGSLTSECGLAWIATEVDSRDQAKNLLDHIMRDLLPREAGYHSWEAQCAVLAHVCRELEAERHAPELFELLSPLRGRIIPRGHVGCHGPASLYLGLLADLVGQRDDAVTYFEEALALAESVSASPWIARIRYCEARALVTSRDAAKIDQARSYAEQSKTLAQELGMKRIEAHASGLLLSLVAG